MKLLHQGERSQLNKVQYDELDLSSTLDTLDSNCASKSIFTRLSTDSLGHYCTHFRGTSSHQNPRLKLLTLHFRSYLHMEIS